MRKSLCIALFASLMAAPLAAQTAGAPKLTTSLKGYHDGIARNVKESAEKVAEDVYGFQPTKDVRTFGQLVGHLANANFNYCSRATGQANPNKQDFEKITRKTDLVKGLADALAYCDGVYAGLTDQSALEPITMGQADAVRVMPLIINASHNNEHYGNLVTYMRLKGIVPPSTERTQARPTGRD